MTTPSAEPILPRHPRWEEFLDRLCGPEGCDFQEATMTWTCFGGTDKRFSRRVLAGMGLSERAIEVSLAYFEDHGGHCDCEVVFNVGEARSTGADPGPPEPADLATHRYGWAGMVAHMKTTVEIADPLLAAAKRAAAARGTTVRALIEAGLRRVLDEADRDAPFRLRDAGFGGDGLAPEFADGGWQRVRDAVYEAHGA